MTDDKPDPRDKLLSAEAAAVAGVSPEQWRKHGPIRDGRWDHRANYWYRSTVEEWARIWHDGKDRRRQRKE